MAIEKLPVDRFLQLATVHPVLDVRSPGEYDHAHLPGACNLPLFTDEERRVVGTAYKQENREKAIKIGLDFFGPKMSKMVEEAGSLVSQPAGQHSSPRLSTDLPFNDSTSKDIPFQNSVLLYCWRGGMRSAAVAWLLDLYGYRVYTLIGGYKKFRNYVLDTFRLSFSFKILGGYTGSGKTDILRSLLQKGEPVIDLEEIAKHKGSAFGSIGLPKQPSQEMFENILAIQLRALSPGHENLSSSASFESPVRIWLEDESQRIGLLNIPNDLWNTMRQSKVYFLDIPFEQRLHYLVKEYGGLNKQQMLDAIDRIREKLGRQNTGAAAQLLEEGNTIESFRILLKYYDKYYLKALHNRERLNSLLHTVVCTSVTPENATQLIRHTRFQPETT